jgi:hypothetical protein
MGSMEGKAEESGIVTAVILQKPAQADAEAGFGVDGGFLIMSGWQCPGTEQNSYQKQEPRGPCVQSLRHRAPCTRKAAMPVHMGIMCERCARCTS